jgi:hypothetical protein
MLAIDASFALPLLRPLVPGHYSQRVCLLNETDVANRGKMSITQKHSKPTSYSHPLQMHAMVQLKHYIKSVEF